MAIDPAVQVRQLRVTGVEEVPCVRCGKPTKRQGGMCEACRNGRNVGAMSTRLLLQRKREIEEELAKRRDEITAALGEKP